MGRKPVPSDVETVPLPSGSGASLRILRPETPGPNLPCLLWIHGGGYIMRSAADDDALCRGFADALGCVVVSVDYRLAPEHPYPAALDDCYSALLWTVSFGQIDDARIAIAGASAGGGLAAALALRARDRGQVAPVAQVLVYPMLDDRTADRPEAGRRPHRMWGVPSNRFGWSCYLGGADPAVAVPARVADLSGLPPTWLGVGDVDLLHDETLSYAAGLRAAGVTVDVEIVPGAFHGFDVFAPTKTVSRQFFASQCAALRSAFDTAEAR